MHDVDSGFESLQLHLVPWDNRNKSPPCQGGGIGSTPIRGAMAGALDYGYPSDHLDTWCNGAQRRKPKVGFESRSNRRLHTNLARFHKKQRRGAVGSLSCCHPPDPSNDLAGFGGVAPDDTATSFLCQQKLRGRKVRVIILKLNTLACQFLSYSCSKNLRGRTL